MNKKIIASLLGAALCITPVFSLAETTKANTTTTAATATTAKSSDSTQSSQKTQSSVQRYEVLILGDRDQEGEEYVKELQRWLKHYGFFEDEPTGYYGEKTQKAVMAFQEHHKTNVDGKAGPVTRRILFGEEYEAIPSSRKVTNALGASIGEYSLGDRGPEIEKIQLRLKELGYYTYSRTTEYYGPITEEAVLAFKKANSLSTDTSKIDAKTYNAIFSDSAKKQAAETTKETTTEKKTTASSSKSDSKTTTTAKKTTAKKTTAAKSSSGSSSSSASSSKVEKMVSVAMDQVGDPYVYGATGPSSFDCSGLIYYALRQVGVSGPRTSAAQSQHSAWQKVSKSQLKRGDLVFFSSPGNSNVGHAGIYLGGGQFVHASSGSKKAVTVSSLSSGSYATRFRWGRRVF